MKTLAFITLSVIASAAMASTIDPAGIIHEAA